MTSYQCRARFSATGEMIEEGRKRRRGVDGRSACPKDKLIKQGRRCIAGQSGTKMAGHAYRKHEGVVTVYELAIANGIQTTPRKCLRAFRSLPLLPSTFLSLLGLAVRIVKVRLTAVLRGRSTVSEWRKSPPTTGKPFEILSAPIARADLVPRRSDNPHPN